MTTEQLDIVAAVSSNNVLVDADAGSGKTTTALLIGKTYNDRKILLLTYNKGLKEETRIKVIEQKLSMTVHSYGSFIYGLTGQFTDKAISSYLQNAPSSKYNYDIIIIDEAQDLTPLYYRFVKRIIAENKEDYKLVIMGDPRQCIFTFNGATSQFIEQADKLFINKYNWKHMTLSRSFRITETMATFINRSLYQKEVITSIKGGDLPRYLYINAFRPDDFYMELDYYFSLGYKVDDIFILAHSVNTKNQQSPLAKIADFISNKKKIPIYIASDDNETGIDKELITGKLVFSTIHKVKGLERKVVIVLGFDNFNTHFDLPICPNSIYVAVTRASERLTLIHNKSQNYFKFVDENSLDKTCWSNKKSTSTKATKAPPKNKELSVSEMCKRLPFGIIDRCLELIEITMISPPTVDIQIADRVKQSNGTGLIEYVADITGTTAGMYCDFMMSGKITVLNQLNIKYENHTSESLLLNANKWIAKMSCVKYKLDQITDYDWLSQDDLDALYNSFKSLNIGNSIFEFPAKYAADKIKLYGAIDCFCLESNSIYEFKCVESLTQSHYIQLVLYMFLAFKIGHIVPNSKNGFEVGDIAFTNNINGPITTVYKNGSVNIKGINHTKITKIKSVDILYAVRPSALGSVPTGYLSNLRTGELIKIKINEENIETLFEILCVHILNMDNSDTNLFVESLLNGSYVEVVEEMEIEECVEEELQPIELIEDEVDMDDLCFDNFVITTTTSNNYKMIFDTETTGFGATNSVIEIGYIVVDSNNKQLFTKNLLIHPMRYGQSYNISAKNAAIHGITQSLAKVGGRPHKDVINEFYNDLLLCDTLIAHNIKFDYDFMIREALLGGRLDLVEELGKKKQVCTMNGKRIKLSSLYNNLFGEDPKQDHRALADAMICYKCYVKMNL